MNQRLRALVRNPGFVCLASLMVILLLIGIVLIARQRVLFQTISVTYTPLSGEARWEGDWKFSEQGADPSEAGSLAGADRVTIPFSGTDLALTVRRGGYRANFFVSVDGAPANRLPREGRNEQRSKQRDAYLVLSSPDYEPQVVTLPVAGGLSDGPHKAVVVTDRGWDQWPLVGWRVSRTPDTTAYDWALAGLGALGFMFVGGVIVQWVGRRRDTRATSQEAPFRVSGFRFEVWDFRFSTSEPFFLVVILIIVAALHLSPWLFLKVIGGFLLAALIFLRLDVGLALIAAAAPFYLKPVALLDKSFSLVEIATLLCVASWGIRCVWQWRKSKSQSRLASCALRLTSLDLAALTFVLVAVASFFVAEYRHVALRELRVLILEPALFYLLLRTSRLDGKAIWRVVHFFVLGAVIVALLGLVQYAFSDVEAVRQALGDVIRAEGGFHRLRSVYGSPNSVGLYLGRVLPVLVAVTLFGGSRNRRIAYGLAVIPVGLAVLLSFSKGALLIGVPLSLLALGVLAGGRWLWASLSAVVAGIVAAIPLLRTPRFASLFDPSRGTLFFRLHLWRSSWAMFRDHPLLGVGPDNFLYHYRGRYILPAAWEEPHLSQAHNILLDYATRMGVAGLAVGAWLQVAFWQVALPLRRLADPDHRALALGLMCSMVSFLSHGFVDASYFLIDLAFAFFLALGVVQWLSRRETHGNED